MCVKERTEDEPAEYETELKDHNNTLIDKTFVAHQFMSPFMPAGQYSFPFSFLLPSDLPNSFKFKYVEYGEDCYAYICYEVEAYIRRPGSCESDLEFSIPLIIN